MNRTGLNSIWTFTTRHYVMKTTLRSNLSSSAQTKINGCLYKMSLTQTLIRVSPLAPSLAQTVWPVQTPPISPAPSQVSVFILNLSVMVTLSVEGARMRNCQCAINNSSK